MTLLLITLLSAISAPDTIILDSTHQLFLDDHIIAHLDGTPLSLDKGPIQLRIAVKNGPLYSLWCE